MDRIALTKDNAHIAYDFWQPEPLFDGKIVFVLGGGPSLATFDCGNLHGLPTVVVNSSAKIALWAPVLYFQDTNWFEANESLVRTWGGIVCTPSRSAKLAAPDIIKRLELVHTDRFLIGGKAIRWGRTSGHSAISLAIAMGAAYVCLLGFDMKRDANGRSHWHDDYNSQDDKMYSHDFIPATAGWHVMAIAANVWIINCTPGSALDEFPRDSIDRWIGFAKAQ